MPFEARGVFEEEPQPSKPERRILGGQKGRTPISEEERRILERQKERTPVSRAQEDVIEQREKTSSRELGGGVNEVRFVDLKDDGSIIFKPKNGETRLLLEQYHHRQFKHERAAYLVSQFLGLDLVPPTVIRELDGEIGSAQEFISDAKVGDDLTEGAAQALMQNKEYLKLAIFDYIIWNSDRHGRNYLVKNEKVYAIDNGLGFLPFTSFGEGTSVSDLYDGGALPDGLAEKFQKFLSWDEGKKILRSLLLELLDEITVNACLKRIEFTGRALAAGTVSRELIRGSGIFNPQV